MGRSALARQLQQTTQVSVESFDDENVKTEAVAVDLDGDIEHVTTAIEKAELDVDTVKDDIDEIDSTTVALEHYAQALRGSLSNGGLSAESAAILNIGLAHIGMRTGQSMTVSTEDFGGRMSRKQATTVSIEDINEKVKSMAAAAKEAFKAFLELLGQFWDGFVTGTDRLAASAEALVAKIDGISGEAKVSEVEFANLPKLSAKGKVVGDSFDSISGELLFVAKTYPVNLIKSIRHVTGLLQSTAGNLDSLKYMTFSNAVISALPDLTIPNVRTEDEKMVTRTLPGDVRIECVHPKAIDDANSFAEFGKVLPEFKIALATSPVNGGVTTASVRSKPELAKFVRSVQVGIKQLQESSKTSRGDMAAALKAYNEQLDNLITAVADDAEEGTTNQEHQDLVNVAQKVQRLFIELTTKGHSGMVSYMARTCGAMLSLANKEADAYGAKATAEAGEAEAVPA